MDRALLKEREAFKRRALATPSFKSLAASGNSSQYKFGVLARIVRHMRSRHQEGETHALTLHEILDETNQLNVGPKIKQWLLHEALPSNPKVRESEEGSGAWVFNPALPVRDRKGLLKLLRLNDIKGLGGVLLDDIQESVPNYARVMKTGMHDDNIAEYLDRQGIKSMQDVARVFRPARRKTKARRTAPTRITDNDHLAHVLHDYEQQQ
ncbi:general transcription factor IIE subunit 2-like [Hyalella azteca]|uniref:General transcription factor IIE subunit 2-like n=1 Tax=Hyalella azteca TaxID=294128 RepID=A0A979FLL8_HYAAZ|nr:general transcription factor IIE subunit 2-like [Hyalella azteca]